MLIPFDIPTLSAGSSSQQEKTEILSSLRKCLRDLGKGSLKDAGRSSLKQTDSTQWTFSVPAFEVDSSLLANAEALSALLGCLTTINTIFLKYRCARINGQLMCPIPRLYDSGVVYDRTSVWDSTPALYARKHGDCKSLTCALVAEYRMQGKPANPVFRWVRRTKENDMIFHILVQTPQGFEDPSKILGMNAHENSYFQRKTG